MLWLKLAIAGLGACILFTEQSLWNFNRNDWLMVTVKSVFLWSTLVFHHLLTLHVQPVFCPIES